MHSDDGDLAPLNVAPPHHLDARQGALRLRRATAADASFVVDLMTHIEIERFLAAVSPSTLEELSEEIRLSVERPAYHGRLVAEVEESTWEPVGSIAYAVANRRSRIAYLSALAIEPGRGGRGLGASVARLAIEYLVSAVGYHRVQCEIYGFNERALAVARKAGFVEEGRRRRAYWRHGEWVDGVLFGALADEFPS
ncbi:MAG: GNAT family N-acetyltransferase [Gaiellaceae bacterium]